MSEWKLKRFWAEAVVQETGGGFSIALDGRGVKTPAKAALTVPSIALAEAIAKEWNAVEKDIDPSVMPYTRSANAAIDKVSTQFDEVAKLVAAYADSDLLCYRADSPAELRERQDTEWDLLLNWVRNDRGLDLCVHEGIMYRAQSAEAQALALHLTCKMNCFELTAFHDLVSLSGSFVIGLAAAFEHEEPANLWKTSRIDEIWQEELWGADEEATAAAAVKEAAFLHAASFFNASRDDLPNIR